MTLPEELRRCFRGDLSQGSALAFRAADRIAWLEERVEVLTDHRDRLARFSESLQKQLAEAHEAIKQWATLVFAGEARNAPCFTFERDLYNYAIRAGLVKEEKK